MKIEFSDIAHVSYSFSFHISRLLIPNLFILIAHIISYQLLLGENHYI